MKNNWLEDIKEGDTVAIFLGFNRYRVCKVARVTATLIITDGGGRYRRKDGYPVGESNSYIKIWLIQATKEIILQVKQRKLYEKAEQLFGKHGQTLTIEQLEQIIKILEDVK